MHSPSVSSLMQQQAEIDRKLARLKNRHTRYEVILTNGTVTYLVQYTGRHSRHGLVDACIHRSEAIRSKTNDTMPYISKPGEPWQSEWRILFSGRTQREAIVNGEHPFATTPEEAEQRALKA